MSDPKTEIYYTWREHATVEGETEPRLLVPWSDPDEYEYPADGIFDTIEAAGAYRDNLLEGYDEDDDTYKEAMKWVLCRETLSPVRKVHDRMLKGLTELDPKKCMVSVNFVVDIDDPDKAEDIVRHSTAFDCVGASPKITHGLLAFSTTLDEFIGALTKSDKTHKKAVDIATWLEGQDVDMADLDDMVHDAASSGASSVNNSSLEEQVEYLLEQGFDEVAIMRAVEPVVGTFAKKCKFCSKDVSTRLARYHQDAPVCESCWDERLRSTE